MTPKTIPCPGSPAAAAPASSLSTSPTRSDSDERTARSHGGLQVKGRGCQGAFPVTAGAAATRLGSDRQFFFFFLNQLKVVIATGCFWLFLSSRKSIGCLTLRWTSGRAVCKENSPLPSKEFCD